MVRGKSRVDEDRDEEGPSYYDEHRCAYMLTTIPGRRCGNIGRNELNGKLYCTYHIGHARRDARALEPTNE